jgi:membrane protease YdiL (CAAX protease family)
VLLLDEAAGVAVSLWDARSPWFDWYPYGPIVATLGHWGLPFAAVYLLEKRGWRSLGLELPRRKVAAYALYALVGLVAPGVILGFDRSLLIEFIEQIAYIGLAEELFFRGYVTSRLLAWLGKARGLLASAFLFSLVHFISRVAQSGFAHPLRLVEVCLQTLVGGLLLGYIYIRARNIYPGSILHVAGNMYIGRLMQLFSQ